MTKLGWMDGWMDNIKRYRECKDAEQIQLFQDRVQWMKGTII